ncbi:MAG: hypothetical protein P4L46_25440 [Fimbriimonas sp.]|nr:hypothetical protein [Fimbriimonas sp.]
MKSLLSVLIFVCMATCAHAQYILSSMSGGSASVAMGYSNVSNTGPNTRTAVGAGSVCHASGAFTFTWTWVGPEPAPLNAIVTYTPSGSWAGAANGGSCTDGMGDPANPPSGNPLTGQGSSATHYAVKPGGDTVTLTCNPTASSIGGTAVASLTASICPVTITLGGTIQDSGGHDECMIGKGITGTLNAQYLISDYSWTIGGNIFKSYVATQAQGKLYLIQPSDLVVPQPHWYWKDASSCQVLCNAQITFPDGTLSVVNTETDCEVYRPESYFGANVLSSACYMGSGTSSSDYNHVLTWKPDPSDLTDTSAMCIEFYGSVGTQSPFYVYGDAGVHTYVQLGNLFDSEMIGQLTIPIRNTWGRFDLDNNFPYPGIIGGPYFPANSVNHTSINVAADGPWMGLAYAVTEFNMNETYRMWQMYHPPTADGDWNWVPLNMIQWSDFAEDSWPWPAAGDMIPGSFVRQDSASSTTTHPEWSYSISNSGGSGTGGGNPQPGVKNVKGKKVTPK